MGKKEGILRVIPGDTLIFFTMLIFGGYSLFLRLFTDISPLAFLSFLQFMGALGFGAIALLQKREAITKKAWVLLGYLVVVALGNDLTYFFAFKFTSVANAALTHQMVSAFLLFLAPIFLKEKTKRNEWASLGLSLLGLFILYGESLLGEYKFKDAFGISLGLVSGFFLACLFILYRLLPQHNLSVVTINFWRHLLSSTVMLPVLASLPAAQTNTENLKILIPFGIIFGVIASGIHNFALGRTRSLHASIIGKSEPAIAIIYAFFFLREVPSVQVIIGGILIIGSSVWLAGQKDNPL